MVDTILSLIPITISTLDADRKKARELSTQFSQEQLEQHYPYFLAAIVVQRCLKLIGIESHLDIVQSWTNFEPDLYTQLHSPVYLSIPEVQKYVWCYPINPGDAEIVLPQCNSIGVVVVQIDDTCRTSRVLGFVQTGLSSTLSVNTLQPLDALIDCLVAPQLEPVYLSHWLTHLFESDWQPFASLLQSARQPILNFAGERPRRNSPSPEMIQTWVNQLYLQQSENARPAPINLAPSAALVQLIQLTQDDEIRWQASELLWEIDPQHPACPVIRAKDLGLYLAGHEIALMVGILSKPDGQILILLRTYPIQQSCLPPGLKLIILEETEQVFQELESRQRDDYMQFKMTANVGDRFKVRVVLNNASFTESFVI